MPRCDWRAPPSVSVSTLSLQSHPSLFSLVYNWNWVILTSLLEFRLVLPPLLPLTVGCWCRMMMQMWTEGWILLHAPTHLESYLRCLSPVIKYPERGNIRRKGSVWGFLFVEGQSNVARNACDRSLRWLVTWHLRSGSRAQTGGSESGC